MKFILSLIVVASLAGCATVRESYSADGRKAYALNCSGTARGWDKCFVAAGEKCGTAGYDVLERNGERLVVGSSSGGYQSSSSAAAVATNRGSAAAAATSTSGGFNSFYTETQERTMLVACKR